MSYQMVRAPSGIGYPVWQTGDGSPLLLLHGFTGSQQSWHVLANRLGGGRRIVMIDLPGHGKSELPASHGWTFESVINDLAWIIESRLGGDADVLGYSMGGRIALALALAHPHQVRRLILESASPGITDEQERHDRRLADEGLAQRILDHGLTQFVAFWERLPMWNSQAALTQGDRERQRHIRLSHTSAGLAANLKVTGTGVQPSYWACLAALRAPTLLITGDLDQKFSLIATRMHETLPDARLEIVSNAGHAVHLEQPDRYVHVVTQFLEKSPSSRGDMRRSDRD